MQNRILKILKTTLIALLNIAVISFVIYATSGTPEAMETLSKMGSRGSEVTAVQQVLKDRGLYTGSIDGIYGTLTRQAVIKFQKQQGLTADGIAGPKTLKALGVSIGSVANASQNDISMLAHIISAESRGEPYIGQVAVGAVVLNRVEHPSFPDTIAGVVYQQGAFTAVTDGQMYAAIEDSAYKAAKDALNGWDPSGGAIYYYNPAKTTNAWIRSRPVITTIGEHVFCS